MNVYYSRLHVFVLDLSMSFEIKDKDLLARIGRLKTRSRTVETPLLLPVVNPSVQPISPRRLKEEFGFQALMTNAYILKKRFKTKPAEMGLHEFLDFEGAIMTDSGAYQILIYGDIEVTPREIIEYQEQIATDIGTILDIPTAWNVTEKHARQTVDETVKRAREFSKIKNRDDILWVGPVQGGRYLRLVARSAKQMGALPFQINALGSPTEVMERYRFDILVDMIMTAKMNLPVEKPLHLFGAGHPFMFALAVALGCDLFDSAAYALYAKESRYMTETGTYRLKEMEYFPCACPKCTHTTPKLVLELPLEAIRAFLAEHNLHACAAELKRIKQATKEGRLWEHLEMRSRGHPALLQAVKKIGKYSSYIERFDPATKSKGLFFFNSDGVARPEVVRFRKRLIERYSPPNETKTLLLAPQTQAKPFHKSKMIIKISKALSSKQTADSSMIHVCFYAAPFGLVPCELDEIYPLSQHETTIPIDSETIAYVVHQVNDYIERTNYTKIVLLEDSGNLGKAIVKSCKRVCTKKDIELACVKTKDNSSKEILAKLKALLHF